MGLIYLIMTSRIYLGVHSINQIIFGFLTGIGIFFLFLPVFKMYHNTPTEFLNNQYKYRYLTIGLNLVGILIFYISFFCRKDFEGVTELTNWKKMCLDQRWSKLLIKGSFMGGESIFIILGMYLGLYHSKLQINKIYQNKEDIIINWQIEKFVPRLIRLILLLIGFAPVGIIFLLNLFDITYIFFYVMTPILFFLGGFLSFGLCLLYGYKFTSAKFVDNEMAQFEPQLKE